MEDYKKRIHDAMTRGYERQTKVKESRGHYGKPEKQVERDCLELMRSWGWSVQILEAKATFDPRRGVWRQQAMKAGTVDCVGSMADGWSVAIEFKAPGRIANFNADKNSAQRKYVEEKITCNVFSCVVDSAKRLEFIYKNWKELKEIKGIIDAREFLFDMLPKKRSSLKDDSLFSD